MPVGSHVAQIKAKEKGRVLWINKEAIVRIARETGAPKEKGSGIKLKAKIGDTVSKDDVLLEIYAERASKLSSALELTGEVEPMGLSWKTAERMLLGQFPAKTSTDQSFVLDR